jgi:hypothetical protein
MAQRTQPDDSSHPLHEAYACLLANGLDGAGEALRILVNEASRIERAQHLQATPYERCAQRVDPSQRLQEQDHADPLGRSHF